MEKMKGKKHLNRKHLLHVLCFLGIITQFVLIACDKKNAESQLEVYPQQITLGETGKAFINVISNTTWKINSTEPSLSFSAMSGSNNDSIEVKVVDREHAPEKCEFSIYTVNDNGAITHTVSVTIEKVSGLMQNEIQNKTYTVNGVSFTMIGVTGGTFWMGATKEQEGDASWTESPMHKVQLSSFSIGQTEVTQELWGAVMDNVPSKFRGDKRPVENVSYEDCKSFIGKLNQLTGETFRMPTEAEWEFAARGGTKSKGYKYAGSDSINYVAWYYDNSYSKGYGSMDYGTHNVATKLPNELNIYDMSGNVKEFCRDYYNERFYEFSSIINPVYTNYVSYSYHVGRGGSWQDKANSCRVASRCNAYDDYNHTGLRLAQ